MADAAAAEEKAPIAVPAPAFPIKLLIIVSVVALLFGVGGAVVAVKLLGGADKGADHSEEHKTEAAAKKGSGGNALCYRQRDPCLLFIQTRCQRSEEHPVH